MRTAFILRGCSGVEAYPLAGCLNCITLIAGPVYYVAGRTEKLDYMAHGVICRGSA